MSSNEYHEPSEDSTFAEVSVNGPGIDITQSVDERTMRGIIAVLFGGNAPTQLPGLGSGGGSGSRDESGQYDDLTLSEFIIEMGAKTFPHKICAASYYLTTIKGAGSFTSAEVRSALADAHEDMPRNFSRDFGNAASENYVARKEGGEAGQFIVPRTGRTAVESKFTELPKRRARRSTKKASASNGGGE
ncbi:hypothetical protein BJ994_001120 [Arthrobacter pigmenti]|uniref:Uncharacterized protein n=1 Tax=Arthrobacter pigmenti TaxID=271432 RepID=A0A846RNW5_9MICC|nr:hypothetical protein [Arthrobacter pigmenti]NJC22044.1 hypothetical protein [Arthrobacter pigmenti]